jgi:hypothetical protein
LQADDRRLGIVAIVLFFTARIPLLRMRQPFFDELFTQWIAHKSIAGIVLALHHDSGPPLYYFLVSLGGNPRGYSLLFATLGFLALLRERQYAAATLLAVFPPAVLFAVDGRAYALCAMFVTLGVLALQRDRRYAAAAWFVLAAYSHYYGVLFFPLVRRIRPALLYLLFLPGLMLALHQPRAAMAWMQPFSYPDALFARPPLLLLIALGMLLVMRAMQPAALIPPPGWVIPYVLSIPIYVPLRFESVIATPLMQWLAAAKKWVFFGLAACFATWTLIGIVEHANRPPDDYQEAALQVRNARERVVASGYLYLYTVQQRSVSAFPAEQAEHPGWRATASAGSELPRGTFLWIGERAAPELQLLRQRRSVEPLWANGHAMIARVR